MKKLKPRRIKILAINYCHLEMDRLGLLFSGIDADGFSFDVLYSDSFINARDIFFNEHPDLVFIHETFEKGIPMCRLVRAHEGDRHTGLIFTTSVNQIISRTENHYYNSAVCLEKGADDVIRFDCSNREFLARVKSVLRLKTMTDELRRANHRLEVLSLTDELTGLANMRRFYKDFGKMISRCRAGEFSLGCLVLDIDHFKQVNDTTDHLVGSRVLGELGRMLRSTSILKKGDLAARFGGDEFVISFQADSPFELKRIAEELRKLISGHVFQIDNLKIKITASFGAAWIHSKFQGSVEFPLKVADHLLYESKAAGRDRVTMVDLLRDSVNFDHISRSHLLHRDASSDDDQLIVANKA